MNRLSVAALLVGGSLACAGTVRVQPPADTEAGITVADVRSRIYRVADDSMGGRPAGEPGNVLMTNYIASELARLGLEPGGENGTFLQTIPMVRRRPDTASSLTVNGEKLVLFTDFAPIRPTSSLRAGTRLAAAGLATVYGGRAGDTTVTLRADQVTGRIVVLDAPLGHDGIPTAVYGTPTGLAISQFPTAAAVAVAAYDLLSSTTRASVRGRGNGLSIYADNPPVALLISRSAAEKLMGSPLSSLRPGAPGRSANAQIGFLDEQVRAA